MKYTDNNDFKFNCETCDFHTNTSWNYKYHLKSDKHLKNTGQKEQKEKRVYRCHHCLYTSTTQTGLNSHMKKYHKDKKSYAIGVVILAIYILILKIIFISIYAPTVILKNATKKHILR